MQLGCQQLNLPTSGFHIVSINALLCCVHVAGEIASSKFVAGEIASSKFVAGKLASSKKQA